MSQSLDSCVSGVRHFNRFYTRKIGVLREGLLDSALSLTEARVLYELAGRDGATASEVRGELGLDAGYLSRILRGFQKLGWLQRGAAKDDARRQPLSLTRSGRATFQSLDARSSDQVRQIVSTLAPGDQGHLLDAMRTIETLLEPENRPAQPYLLRAHGPGDLGWVVHRHGVLYSEEWGYDERFEALVAQIVSEFVQRFDPDRERCWIAERNGERIGSVFLVRPAARGSGIGKRLVEECIRFARQCRYRKILLWTQSELKAARTIYQQ